mgnify:CR=1 FL=1
MTIFWNLLKDRKDLALKPVVGSKGKGFYYYPLLKDNVCRDFFYQIMDGK